jgi:hypothetical protein
VAHETALGPEGGRDIERGPLISVRIRSCSARTRSRSMASVRDDPIGPRADDDLEGHLAPRPAAPASASMPPAPAPRNELTLPSTPAYGGGVCAVIH